MNRLMIRQISIVLISILVIVLVYIVGQNRGKAIQVGIYNTDNVYMEFEEKIAIIVQDEGVEYNGVHSNFANELVSSLGSEFVVTSREAARKGLLEGNYLGAITFTANFSKSVVSINNQIPMQAEIYVELSQNLNENQRYIAKGIMVDTEKLIDDKLSYIYVTSVFKELNKNQDSVSEILKNDNDDLKAISSLNSAQLLASIDLADLTEVELEIEEVDLKTPSEKSQMIMSRMTEKYAEYLGVSSDRLEEIKSGMDEHYNMSLAFNGLLNDFKIYDQSLEETFGELSSTVLEYQVEQNFDNIKLGLEELWNLQGVKLNIEQIEQAVTNSFNSIENMYKTSKNQMRVYNSLRMENLVMTVLNKFVTEKTNQNPGYVVNAVDLVAELKRYPNKVDVTEIIRNPLLLPGTMDSLDNKFENIEEYVKMLMDIYIQDPKPYFDLLERMDLYEKFLEIVWEKDQETSDLLFKIRNNLDTQLEQIKNNIKVDIDKINIDLSDSVDKNTIKLQQGIDEILTKGNQQITLKDQEIQATRIMVLEKIAYIKEKESKIGEIKIDYNKFFTDTDDEKSKFLQLLENVKNYDPFKAIEQNQGDLDKLIEEYANLNQELIYSVEKFLQDNSEFVKLVYSTASDNTSLVSGDLEKYIFETTEKLESGLKELISTKNNNVKANKDIIEEFNNMLPNSRIGTVENSSLYKFMNNPINWVDKSYVEANANQINSDNGINNNLVLFIIIILLGVITGLYIMSKLLTKKDKKEEQV